MRSYASCDWQRIASYSRHRFPVLAWASAAPGPLCLLSQASRRLTLQPACIWSVCDQVDLDTIVLVDALPTAGIICPWGHPEGGDGVDQPGRPLRLLRYLGILRR